MFAVIFEVHPKPDQWDTYLGTAKMLRPELEQIDGFIDNVRYKSLTRDGWLLSLSTWRDEQALIRWRTNARHHLAQQAGRSTIFQDYHLRVGQITDETGAADATAVTLITTKPPAPSMLDAEGLTGCGLFDAILTPGNLILLASWRTQEHAEAYENTLRLPAGARLRRVRIIRDYGMFDRREAPQYFPDPPA